MTDHGPCDEVSDETYFRRFNAEIVRRRIPLMGSLALTHSCNLRCLHCYVSGDTRPDAEITTATAVRILDESAAAGCLYLLITGGEPLLRPDFSVIYEHARRLGMLVTVHTNGTMIDRDRLTLFRTFPPVAVEITLYGATAATSEQVTGVRGSHERCLAGVRALLDAQVPVRLKTMVLTCNRHEVKAMEAIAADLGVRFRQDAAVFPRLNGDRSPLQLRVPAADAVALEMTSERERDWCALFERQRHLESGDRLYGCGSGVTAFHVDPWGGLHPCIMAHHIGVDLNRVSFADAWRSLGADMAARRAPANLACRTCDLKAMCGYCPAFFMLETGSETTYSAYLCELGHERMKFVSGEPGRKSS